MLVTYIPNITGHHIKQGANLKQTPETFFTEQKAWFYLSIFFFTHNLKQHK